MDHRINPDPRSRRFREVERKTLDGQRLEHLRQIDSHTDVIDGDFNLLGHGSLLRTYRYSIRYQAYVHIFATCSRTCLASPMVRLREFRDGQNTGPNNLPAPSHSPWRYTFASRASTSRTPAVYQLAIDVSTTRPKEPSNDARKNNNLAPRGANRVELSQPHLSVAIFISAFICGIAKQRIRVMYTVRPCDACFFNRLINDTGRCYATCSKKSAREHLCS